MANVIAGAVAIAMPAFLRPRVPRGAPCAKNEIPDEDTRRSADGRFSAESRIGVEILAKPCIVHRDLSLSREFEINECAGKYGCPGVGEKEVVTDDR